MRDMASGLRNFESIEAPSAARNDKFETLQTQGSEKMARDFVFKIMLQSGAVMEVRISAGDAKEAEAIAKRQYPVKQVMTNPRPA